MLLITWYYRVSSGPDATYNLNKVKRGSEFTTGKQIHPWVELDLGAEINIAGVINKFI